MMTVSMNTRENTEREKELIGKVNELNRENEKWQVVKKGFKALLSLSLFSRPEKKVTF